MLHVYDNHDTLLTATAEFFVKTGREAIDTYGRYSVALSGGSSPQKLYALLASEPYRTALSWDKVFFFFGDERFVPANDPQSNYRMAAETLFLPLAIPMSNIFPVNTTVSPDASARMYEQALRRHFGDECRFDLMLLGLGDNAHTASLFPNTTVLHEQHVLVKEIFVEEVNQFRITFTAPLINQSKTIAFLVFGSGKAEAVHHILNDPYDPDRFPAQLVKPHSGKVYWFLDKAAAEKVCF